MSNLSEGQVQYLRDVLGIESAILPSLTHVVETGSQLDPKAQVSDATVDLTVDATSEWRSSGDENSAKIMILVASESASFPLDGDSGELANKMIQAMKFASAEVFILEWTHAQSPAPAAVFDTVSRAAKPVLIFGPGTARSFMGHFPAIGEWSSWEGVRFVATESPVDLLQRPELKRVAWSHMQSFMKGLSFG